ncbi:MAG: hypothetical protein NTW01_01045 [Gammaproteobacteria bacterium]|nr:hypothetical protein [Gammaproteobacteria bacterium]
MSTPLNSQAALASAGRQDAESDEPRDSGSAPIGLSMAERQHAVSPPRRRDLMLAARAAALDQFLIPVEAIHDERSLQAFLKIVLKDYQLLSLTLLKSRIPRQQLQAQHADVIRVLAQADVITPL